MKKLLGPVSECFPISPLWTVMILEGNVSEGVEFGGNLEVEYATGEKVQTILEDGLLQKTGERVVTSFKVLAKDVPDDEKLIGSKLYYLGKI